MMSKYLRKVVLPICILTGIATSTMTADAKSSDDDWHFSLSPIFLWGVNIDGTSTIGPVSAPLDISFTDDVVGNISSVFTIHFEAQKRDWTIFTEYQYINLDPSTRTPSGVKTDINFKDQIGELGVAYKVFTFGINDLEVLGGVRVTRQDLNVKLGPGVQLLDVSETWWDGFAGLRIFTHMSENWTFIGRVDYGTGGSEYTWNLVGMVDYQFKDWGSVFFGYKWMDYDYGSGSGLDYYAYNAIQQGPLAGFSIHW